MIKVSLGIFLLLAVFLFWKYVDPKPPVRETKLNSIEESDSIKSKESKMNDKIIKSDEEWKKELTPEEFRILREKGTERAFTGKFWNHFEYGTYICAACGTELFESDTKFESGCGWPSYFQPIDSSRIIYKEDKSFGMVRTEVMCSNCGGHLGHVFDDGPPPTGLRYCINSGSMKFVAKKK